MTMLQTTVCITRIFYSRSCPKYFRFCCSLAAPNWSSWRSSNGRMCGLVTRHKMCSTDHRYCVVEFEFEFPHADCFTIHGAKLFGMWNRVHPIKKYHEGVFHIASPLRGEANVWRFFAPSFSNIKLYCGIYCAPEKSVVHTMGLLVKS